MNLFFNASQELRSGWKFAAYVVIFFLLLVASQVALSLVYPSGSEPDRLTAIALSSFLLFVPAAGTPLLMARFVDHRPLKAFGIGFVPNWRRDFGMGLALAAGMLAVLVAGCYAFGFVSIGWTATQVPLTTLAATLGLLMLAAANEELIFRGMPLQILAEGAGTWPASLIMSAIFGLMHMDNPNASLLSLGTVNTILAGVLLSLAYIKTRSLWLPYGIHAAWNIGLGFILGFPLSGVDIASLWTTGIAGSDAILGGDYGPEGGLLATFLFATSALIVHRWKPATATSKR